MIHLRLLVPPGCTDEVELFLVDDDRVTHVITLRGAGRDPVADVVLCDVAREAASEVLETLRALGVDGDQAGIALETVDAAPSHGARRAEEAAPGSPEDGIVWDIVVGRSYEESTPSWSFYAFLLLATTIASVAVVTDSSVLVVGAMVVGPEFGPVAALAVGLAGWGGGAAPRFFGSGRSARGRESSAARCSVTMTSPLRLSSSCSACRSTWAQLCPGVLQVQVESKLRW